MKIVALEQEEAVAQSRQELLEHIVQEVLAAVSHPMRPNRVDYRCSNNLAVLSYVSNNYPMYRDFINELMMPLIAAYEVISNNNTALDASIPTAAPYKMILGHILHDDRTTVVPVHDWQDVSRYVSQARKIGLLDTVPVTDDIIAQSMYLRNLRDQGKRMPNYYIVPDITRNINGLVHSLDELASIQ